MPDINTLVDEIKTLGEGKVSVVEFTAKVDELKATIDTRNTAIEEKMKAEKDASIEAIKLEFQTKLADAVKEMGKSFIDGNKGEKEMPDEKTYGKSFGEFLYKVKAQGHELKTLSENSGATGGYLVPETWSNEIWKIAIEKSIVRNIGARSIKMASPQMNIPSITSTSRSGSVYGGIITYWGNEATNLSTNKTTPAFGKISLDVQKLYGYTESYEDMNMDSTIALGPLLQELFGGAITFEEDYQFLNGNGVNKPLGVISAPCRVTVSRATASQVHTEDIVGMLARFSGNLDSAYWIINQTTLPYLYKLQDAAGNYIWFPGMNNSVSGASPGSLYGIPLIISEKVPALGSEGDVVLGDFSNYIIGDIHGLRVEESKDYKFGEDIRCWKIVKRVDGKPWLNTAITPKNGSTLSPFVILY